MEETIQMIKDYPIENNNKPSNLTRDEQLAIRSLAGDSSIVIKEADKGGAVVIMDADYYRDKISEMLSDEEFYSEINSDMDSQTRKLIKTLVDKHGAGLYKEEADDLKNFKQEISYFYRLPKIHKSDLIKRAIKEQQSEYIQVLRQTDLKFRPIVGGPNSSTQRLSHLLDLILKPLCPEVPSFIRDNIDFPEPSTPKHGEGICFSHI